MSLLVILRPQNGRGALRNKGLHFLGQDIHIRVEQTDTAFTHMAEKGQVMKIPVAHGEGNYNADPDTIKMLEDDGRVIFRYVNEAGEVTPEANLNGSINNIAGISSANKRVVGLMPHPERACDTQLEGKSDGLAVLRSAVNQVM